MKRETCGAFGFARLQPGFHLGRAGARRSQLVFFCLLNDSFLSQLPPILYVTLTYITVAYITVVYFTVAYITVVYIIVVYITVVYITVAYK